MQMKGTKIFVEVDGSTSSPTESRPVLDNRPSPIFRGPIHRSCRRAERGYILGDGRYNPHCAPEVNGNPAPTTQATDSGSSGAYHVGVQCDGCECEIRGYRYKCIECPDYDLCFSCEMKKIHGDHMMIRIVKPLEVSETCCQAFYFFF